jgi:hypothetical protein
VAFTATAEAVVVVSVYVKPHELVPENFHAKFGVAEFEKLAELEKVMVNNFVLEPAAIEVPAPEATLAMVLLKKSVEPFVYAEVPDCWAVTKLLEVMLGVMVPPFLQEAFIQKDTVPALNSNALTLVLYKYTSNW